MKLLAFALVLASATPAFATPVTNDVFGCFLQKFNSDGTDTRLQTYKGTVDNDKVIFSDNGLDYKAYNNGDATTFELEVQNSITHDTVYASMAINSTYLSIVIPGPTQKELRIFGCEKAKPQTQPEAKP